MASVKRLRRSALTVVVLLLMLGVTAAALFFATLHMDENTFQTGTIKITLSGENGSENPVFDQTNFLLEPGRSFYKTLVVQNESTGPVHYSLYLQNLEGALADSVVFSIYKDGVLLKTAVASALTAAQPLHSTKALEVGEAQEFLILVQMPVTVGNEAQGGALAFDIAVTATQAIHNPDANY